MFKRPFSLIIALLLSSLLPPQLHAEGSVTLPELGNSSAITFSAHDEKKTGRAVMTHLKRSGLLIEDPFLKNYLIDLGYRLVPHANDPDNDYTFFLVNDNAINAFALPGGYIGIHSGLILATRNEDELAAVIAHEIAHVSQHHLARRFEQTEGMSLAMTAALIAAILVGGDNPQLAQAAIATTSAVSAQKQLDFTRENEHEADRVGMGILAGADYTPSSMATFFERLQSESRYYTHPPEFLSTHPITENRIADALNRASQYPKRSTHNGIDYLMAKAMLETKTTKDINKLDNELSLKMKADGQHASKITRFSHALALERSGKSQDAYRAFEALLGEEPENLYYLYHLAELAVSLKLSDTARRLYQQGLAIYPSNEALVLGYAGHLIDGQQYDEARELLNGFLRHATENARAYQLLAMAESKSGNKHASQLALAEHYYLENELHSAIDQLQLAIKDPNIDYYDASRIEARLKQLQDEATIYADD